MANVIRLKRASGSDPAASDLVSGEPAVRTDTGELFFKKDDGSIAKVAGAGGGPDFKYLALRNAANNGAASFPNADFTLVTSGTTTAITPTAANTLLVSVNGVIQKPNTGTSTPSSGFALSGSTIKFGANISAAPDFILYQESGGIGEPSDDTVSEVKLKVSNSPVNGYFLSAQSGNNGGLTWAAPIATSCTGNSATATALATARAINGVNFDGTAAITVTAAAGTLTGNTLNSSVVTSSLTSLGDLSGLTVNGDMALTGANYNVLWDKSANALEFADNAKAVFGTGSDLQIYHDGTDNLLSTVGKVLAVHRGTTNAGNPVFEVRSNHGATNQIKFQVDGDGDVLIPTDTGKLQLGVSQDLQIYHNGTASKIDNSTGNLTIKTDNILGLYTYANTEAMAKFIADGAVELYHDNSKKFETTSGGVTVTGNITASGLIATSYISVGDDDTINAGDANDIKIYHQSSDNNSYIENDTGNLIIRSDAANKDITLQAADILAFNTGGANERMRIDSAGRLLLGTTTEGVDTGNDLTIANSGDCGITIRSGTSSKAKLLFSDGTSGDAEFRGNIQYDHNGDYMKFSTAASEHMRIDSSGNIGIGTTSPNVSGFNTDAQVLTLSGPKRGFIELRGDIQAADSIGGIRFFSANNLEAEIFSVTDGSYNGDLRFTTNGSERMRIDSSGNIMFGTTSNSVFDDTSGSGVVIRGATGALDIMRNNDHPLLLNRTGGDGQMIMFHRDGVNKSAIAIRSNSLCFDMPSGTEKMRINSSGLVGINETTPVNLLTISTSGAQSDTVGMLQVRYTGTNGNANAGLTVKSYSGTSQLMQWETYGVRIGNRIITNSGEGNVFITAGNDSVRKQINADGQTNHYYTTAANPKEIYHWSNNRTGMSFRSASTERGNIFFFDSGVQFNTSSDYRLKENVTSISDGITRIKQLIPRKFNWIVDESNTPVDGFLAHEVSSIVPEAVNGTKDAIATQEDVDSGRSQKVGDPIHQMIDHSKLVPLLTAALQEAIGRIEALEAK